MAECVRRAWLVMGERTLPLEDLDAGYLCSELDLGGMGEVRAVVADRPAQDGVDDRTAYMGARAIAAEIQARAGGSMTVDEIGAVFAPYMVPNARPELHYVLERPGAPERFTTVRGSAYTWPISGARTRSIHLGWVAADPVMYGAERNTVVAYAGSPLASGRGYSWAPNRIYPPGGNSPTTGDIASPGDVVFRPLLRIYGPATAPVVSLTPTTGSDPAGPPANITFRAGFVIGSGQWVDVDTAAKTAFLYPEPARSVMAQIDWAASVWPALPTLPYHTWLAIRADSASSTTQVEASWYDGYLS